MIKFFMQAIDFLLTNGEDLEAMKTAITCVAEAHDPELNSRMIDFLLGEVDGIPKVSFSRSRNALDSCMKFYLYAIVVGDKFIIIN